VKRHYIDTLQPAQEQQLVSSRHASSEDYSDHSTSSEDVPTDLSKRHHHQPPAIIHPYPPLPSTLFQPHLDFHSMVVERLQQRFEQQHSAASLCLYPDTAPHPYSEYLLPPLYHPRAPTVLPAVVGTACTPGAAGGLLLDLTLKASTPITPPATPSPVQSAAPSSKRPRSAATAEPNACTPDKLTSTTKSPGSSPTKRTKAVRKLHFDEDKSSPVSGTIIRELNADDPPLVVRKGDIDPAFNVVEVTEEAKAELAKIENKIGDYICKLCCEMYDDAFSLAQHRCSRIVHVEYRCPECDKVFNCPANLASHRRWHKPRPTAGALPAAGNTVTTLSSEPVDLVKRQSDSSSSGDEQEAPLFPCEVCHKRFRRQAYLKKHLATHSSGRPSSPTQPSSAMTAGMMCAPAPLPPPPPPPLLQLAD
jgi:hypothetical protein